MTVRRLYVTANEVKGYRYDPKAYPIVEADMKSVNHQLLNIDLVDRDTDYNKPFTKI